MTTATYINEHLHTRYPFKAGVFVPFPDSLISSLKICVPEACSDVYISSVLVKAGSVRVTVCVSVDGTEKLLGYISGGKTAETVSTDPDYPLNGFLFTGQLSDEDSGVYNGKFRLDPSCIVLMPTLAYRRYFGLSVNGYLVIAGRKLAIHTVGLFRSDTDAVITLSDAAKDAHFVLWDNEYAYTKVLTINGMSATRLHIVTSGGIMASSSVIRRGVPTVSAGEITSVGSSGSSISAVDVILCGGSSFAHCYGTDDESER